MTKTFRAKMGQEYPVKLYQAVLWTTAILALIFVVAYGVVRYNQDSKAQTCRQLVQSREDLRGVILGIYNAIETDGENELVQQLRVSLDTDYPERSFEDCMAGEVK